MSFKHRLYLIAFLIVFLLLLFVYLDGTEADAIRPRYTLIFTANSLYFINSDEFPFQLIREMCWGSSVGWCDPQFENARSEELWIVIDWQNLSFGSVREIENECFWWMYRSDYGEDNQPHIAAHYWVECAVLN